MAQKPKQTTARGAKKPSAEEEEPVLSGRMVTALAFALAMSVIPVSGLGKAITKTSPETADRTTWKVGETATIHITVVTADYNQLGCASEKTVNGQHCEFENEKERFPHKESDMVDDNKSEILQPYRTTDRNLILAAGLWAQPEIATRLHNEPSTGVATNKLARFVVACDVKFIEEWQKPLIRWNPNERWADHGDAMVSTISACHILEDED